jgi:protein O-GlcNAc transferase
MSNIELEQAIVLYNIKEFKKAEIILQEIIKINKNDSNALNILGAIAAQRKDYKKSLEYLKSSIKINDLNYITLNNLGLVYLNLKKLDLAILNFNKALQINQNYAPLFNNIGVYYAEKKEFDKAIRSYEKAITINSDYFEAFNNIGLAYFQLENFNEAKKNYSLAIKLNNKYYEAYNNLGILLSFFNKNIEAIECFSSAIKIKKDYVDAYFNRGETYFKINNFKSAINDLETSINYDREKDNGTLLSAKLRICDWNNINETINYLKNKILNNNSFIDPFISLIVSDSTYLQKKNIENLNLKNNIIKVNNFNINFNKKIKVGYVSYDFRKHPVSQLICDTFETHDKDKFEIYTFKLNSLFDSFTKRISNSTNLIDLSSYAIDKITTSIKKFKIDIAIDLMGFTNNAKPKIFYNKIAPLHVNFLGYPGTVGHNNMDYIIADQFVIKEEYQNNFLEKIIYLPHCYQPSNKIIDINEKSFSKKKFNLPEDKFIFCCFNSSHKINPFIFNIWVKILKKVKKSVLWILTSNLDFENNLLNEFKKNNVDSNRIIFCRFANLDEHLERFKCADLFLDTFPYCAHTTANESLQQNLPLVALCGESFASRVSGSLLKSINLSELITYNAEEYENTVVRLAENTKELQHIKNKIILNKKFLSDVNTYTSNLEKAYYKIHQIHLNSEEAKNIYIN